MVRQFVGLGFELAAEIVVECLYVQNAATDYDPQTGTNGATTLATTLDALVGQYSQKETDGQRVRAGDEKLLVKASELGAIVPEVDDYLVDGTVKRQVVAIHLDPTGTLYTLQCRKQIIETTVAETDRAYRLQLRDGGTWYTLGEAEGQLNLTGSNHRIGADGPQLQDALTGLWHTYLLYDGQIKVNPTGEA